jgi:dTDP-glucose 4,6-dehydratase
MIILITGILGVVGSKLEVTLIKKGHKVFGVDLFHADRKYGHGLGNIEDDNYFRCDISQYRQIEEVIKYVRPDCVYNCAAEFGRWNGEYFYEQVWKTNAIGMKNIIRLQEKYDFKLIHCSSSEVYGNYEGIMYEDITKEIPIIQMNDYAMSKMINEMQISNSMTMYNTKTVIVRLFNTYGPGEWYHPFRSVNCIFCYNLLHNRPIKVFRGHLRTSTYIYDAVETISNIIDNFKPGEIYNIASSENHTIEHLAEIVLEKSGASEDLIVYIDKHEILTTVNKYTDISKAIKDLKHTNSICLNDGVEQTVKWMKNYYNIGD